jgi:phosphoribosyl 1,2-cyclic phosphodiesterase
MKEFGGKPRKGDLLISHTHWDHSQGFPFFTPFYMPQNRFNVYGAHGTTRSFEEVIGGQMHPMYFPVSLKDLGGRLDFIELSGPLSLGEVKVTTHYLNHPGITVGFRIEIADKTVAYLSDHEPYSKLNAKGDFSVKEDEAVAAFAQGADLLISESQYTEEEYRDKKSWGHSTFSDVIGLAAKANAKRLALFHHDPIHTDEMMDKFMEDCHRHIKEKGYPLECLAAQEGMRIEI